jgi:GTP-binding protein HflX
VKQRKRARRSDPAGAHKGAAEPAVVGAGTRALVVHPVLRRPAKEGTAVLRSAAGRLDEAIGLARALGLDVADGGIVQVQRARPATLLGSGKVAELAGIVQAEDAEVVIVDGPLTPVQQRNLERAWNAKVLDRTGLILEIFAARAQTREGRLQVELARLTYQRSRLVRSWTHLERQRGALGFVGGPGETQIEADRRQIQERIVALKGELAAVTRTRALHRASRRKVPFPVVALVGYTNAGKSTLFNRLSGAAVMAEDLLFATLDPTMRKVALPHGARVILSDTVGFISDLPTHLVAAFRATLEEVTSADLVVHVRDLAHPDSGAQAEDVASVLALLWGEDTPPPMLEAWNKIDLVEPQARLALAALSAARGDAVAVSALTGEGLDGLLIAIEERLAAGSDTVRVVLDAAAGRDINWIYQNCEVLRRSEPRSGAVELELRVPAAKRGQLAKHLGGQGLPA